MYHVFKDGLNPSVGGLTFQVKAADDARIFIQTHAVFLDVGDICWNERGGTNGVPHRNKASFYAAAASKWG